MIKKSDITAILDRIDARSDDEGPVTAEDITASNPSVFSSAFMDTEQGRRFLEALKAYGGSSSFANANSNNKQQQQIQGQAKEKKKIIDEILLAANLEIHLNELEEAHQNFKQALERSLQHAEKINDIIENGTRQTISKLSGVKHDGIQQIVSDLEIDINQEQPLAGAAKTGLQKTIERGDILQAEYKAALQAGEQDKAQKLRQEIEVNTQNGLKHETAQIQATQNKILALEEAQDELKQVDQNGLTANESSTVSESIIELTQQKEALQEQLRHLKISHLDSKTQAQVKIKILTEYKEIEQQAQKLRDEAPSSNESCQTELDELTKTIENEKINLMQDIQKNLRSLSNEKDRDDFLQKHRDDRGFYTKTAENARIQVGGEIDPNDYVLTKNGEFVFNKNGEYFYCKDNVPGSPLIKITDNDELYDVIQQGWNANNPKLFGNDTALANRYIGFFTNTYDNLMGGDDLSVSKKGISTVQNSIQKKPLTAPIKTQDNEQENQTNQNLTPDQQNIIDRSNAAQAELDEELNGQNYPSFADKVDHARTEAPGYIDETLDDAVDFVKGKLSGIFSDKADPPQPTPIADNRLEAQQNNNIGMGA